MSEFGDFNSSDPLERFNAHQRAKGRTTMPDPDVTRKALREDPPVIHALDVWFERELGDAKAALDRLDAQLDALKGPRA